MLLLFADAMINISSKISCAGSFRVCRTKPVTTVSLSLSLSLSLSPSLSLSLLQLHIAIDTLCIRSTRAMYPLDTVLTWLAVNAQHNFKYF